MKRERVLELIDRWSWWFSILRDIVKESNGEVRFSDVWSKCVNGRDEETCLGVVMALAVAVRHEVKPVEDLFSCVGGCDEEYYKAMGDLFKLMGVEIFPEVRYEMALADGYRAIVLDGLAGVAAKLGIDVGKWLDWCVRLFDSVECVYAAESIINLKEVKNEVEKYRGGGGKR